MATPDSTGSPARSPFPNTEPLSPGDVRSQVRDFVSGLVERFVAQRGPWAGGEAFNAAVEGIEDAAAALNPKGASDAGVRHDHRVGQIIAHDLDRLFRGRALLAVENGEDPEREVNRLYGLVYDYMVESAMAASRAAVAA